MIIRHYSLMFWYTYLFLNFLSVFAGLLTMYSSTTINLLLLIVIITFFQGINLLLLGANLISLYLMIIYLGAIVILFSFMVLFINWEEQIKTLKSTLKIISFLIGIVFTHIPLVLSLDSNPLRMSTKKIESFGSQIINGTIDSINYLSNVFYSIYLLILVIMILILFLGLLLVIRLVLNKEHK